MKKNHYKTMSESGNVMFLLGLGETENLKAQMT